MPLGGAVSDIACDATAFPHRQHSFTMQIIARWMSQEDDGSAIAWVEGLRNVITSQQRYKGEMYSGWQDGSVDRYKALGSYYGRNLSRLVQVKMAVDPLNIFQYPHSIATETHC